MATLIRLHRSTERRPCETCYHDTDNEQDQTFPGTTYQRPSPPSEHPRRGESGPLSDLRTAQRRISAERDRSHMHRFLCSRMRLDAMLLPGGAGLLGLGGRQSHFHLTRLNRFRHSHDDRLVPILDGLDDPKGGEEEDLPGLKGANVVSVEE